MSESKKTRPADGNELSDADMEAVVAGLGEFAADAISRASGAASFAAKASFAGSGKHTFGAGIKT